MTTERQDSEVQAEGVVPGLQDPREAPPQPRQWAYGLTADEWLHLAAEGENSEVAPCCGNIGELREILNVIATDQTEDGTWRKLGGRRLLEMLDGDDGYGHELDDTQTFPLFTRVLNGIRKEQADG